MVRVTMLAYGYSLMLHSRAYFIYMCHSYKRGLFGKYSTTASSDLYTAEMQIFILALADILQHHFQHVRIEKNFVRGGSIVDVF